MEVIFTVVTLFFVYFLIVRIDSTRVRKLTFMYIPVAHRGLYRIDQSIPENSLAAFRNAVEHGYAIELDVQCSQDLEVFVFHDNDLQRMCGRSDKFKTMDVDEIKTLKLGSTDEEIPTFAETLKQVDGKVPLWIEIKTTEKRKETVDKVMQQLKDYKGQFSVCSFDPLILLALKQRYPNVIRGIIVENFFTNKSRPWIVMTALYFCLMNFIVRPDYQSFDVVQRKHPTYRLNRLLGAHSVFWVIRSIQQENRVRRSCDNIIFEHYLPDTDIPSKSN